MRTLLAFTIVLCLVGGLYLAGGKDIYWPARGDPSQALLIRGVASQLLAGALFAIAALGVMTVRHASRAGRRAASRRWQTQYFLLLVLALSLIAGAVWQGEVVRNPESRQFGESSQKKGRNAMQVDSAAAAPPGRANDAEEAPARR